jgi:hypothetical protein
MPERYVVKTAAFRAVFDDRGEAEEMATLHGGEVETFVAMNLNPNRKRT